VKEDSHNSSVQTETGTERRPELKVPMPEIICFKCWTPRTLKEKWITKINPQTISNQQTCDDQKLFTHN